MPGIKHDVEEFRRILRNSKHIVAIAGAGLSAASGIPTFRGAGGLWRSFDAISLATPAAFAANPSRVWQFYHMRREKVRGTKPNPAHLALATLAIPEMLRAIAPHATFALVTQNIDGLSTQALDRVLASRPAATDPTTPGSGTHAPLAPLYEIHGRLFDTICTSCGVRKHNTDSPVCAALGGTEVLTAAHAPEPDIPLEDLPRCKEAGCGGLLRPGVVWFGEVPHHLPEVNRLVDEADLAIVVGTSSTVYPAAGYAYEVKENGGVVAVFNMEESDGDEDADFVFRGPCEELLPQVLFGTKPSA